MKRHLWPTAAVLVCVAGVILSAARGYHYAVAAFVLSTVWAVVALMALERAEQWHRTARVWKDIARGWRQTAEDAIADTDQAVRDGETAVRVALSRVAAREGDAT